MSVFWEGLISSSVSLAIIGFICKLFLNHVDKRGIESYKSKLKFESELRRSQEERAYNLKQAKELEVGRWGLTLLSAANGVLGRLLYIKDNHPLTSDVYYFDSTRYYICQYLCWAELFRRNRDLSVFSPTKDEILITELIKNVSIELRHNSLGFPVIRSLEQKYIGDSLDNESGCISYKKFLDEKILENDASLNDFTNALLQYRNSEYLERLIEKFEDLKREFEAVLQKI
ncbi:hypothetical protein EH228_16530 [Erwinia endophytica]|uniref:hypothetical protein n=1 Tax=Erwinia endophytica TaxID=1563158 RepID=UPI001265DFED|nr:hypothetical protein [Erwinia endophytica]KAB8306730.1 hypothetical protein EH228_16530 [Erwinia endophytica]